MGTAGTDESRTPHGVWRGEGSVTLAQGVFSPGILLGWSDRAVLNATFSSFRRLRFGRTRRLSVFGRVVGPPMPGRPEFTSTDLGDLVVADEAGTSYAPCHAMSVSFGRRFAGEPDAPADLEVRLEPAPPIEATWIELRGADGSAARLVRGQATQPSIRQTTEPEGSASEREVEALARSLLAFSLFGVKANRPDAMRQVCARALTRATALGVSPAAAVPESLVEDLCRLANVLEGDQGERSGLPARWAGPIEAAALADGPSIQRNVATVLPVADGIQLALGALVSAPSLWQVSLTAAPGWWRHDGDRQERRAAFSAWAADDKGGHYVSMFGGTTSAASGEDLVLDFRPRLDPAARCVRLTFEGPEVSLTAEIDLSQ